METESFPGVKSGRGVLLTNHPVLLPRSCKSRAIPRHLVLTVHYQAWSQPEHWFLVTWSARKVGSIYHFACVSNMCLETSFKFACVHLKRMKHTAKETVGWAKACEAICICWCLQNDVLEKFMSCLYVGRCTRWRCWLRHCATSRKFAGSIPDGIFHWHNPSGRTMALGLTQTVTEMSTRNIPWGKGGRCVGLTTLPPLCADCLEIWEPQNLGNLRAYPGL